MFTDDEKNAARLRKQRTLFSAWIAAAAFAVVVTMAAGLLNPANAAPAALEAAAGAALENRDVITGVIITSFAAMAAGAISLTRKQLRGIVSARRRAR